MGARPDSGRATEETEVSLNLHELFQSLYKIQQERRINPNYHNWNEIEFFIMDEEPQTRAEEVAWNQEAANYGRQNERLQEAERELRNALNAHRAANPMLNVRTDPVDQAMAAQFNQLPQNIRDAERMAWAARQLAPEVIPCDPNDFTTSPSPRTGKAKKKPPEVPLITESDHFL